MKQHDPSAIVSSFGPGSTNGMTTLTTSPNSASAANAIGEAARGGHQIGRRRLHRPNASTP